MVRRNGGFTLLELMVAMAIVGVLTAIVVPQYRDYRRRAYDLRALSDLRNIAVAEEAYFFDAEAYLSCTNLECAELPGISALSDGVEVSVDAAEDSFTGRARHQLGTGRVYRWDSEQGGLLP